MEEDDVLGLHVEENGGFKFTVNTHTLYEEFSLEFLCKNELKLMGGGLYSGEKSSCQQSAFVQEI